MKQNLNIEIGSPNVKNMIVQTHSILVQAKKFMHKCHTAFQGLIIKKSQRYHLHENFANIGNKKTIFKP